MRFECAILEFERVNIICTTLNKFCLKNWSLVLKNELLICCQFYHLNWWTTIFKTQRKTKTLKQQQKQFKRRNVTIFNSVSLNMRSLMVRIACLSLVCVKISISFSLLFRILPALSLFSWFIRLGFSPFQFSLLFSCVFLYVYIYYSILAFISWFQSNRF